MRKSNIFSNPYILMIILLVLWGSFAAVSKLVLRNVDSFQVQFYMFGFAFITMTVVFVVNGKIKELATLTGKDCVKLLLFSMPSFFYYFLYILSLKLIPAVEASMLNYLFPVMIVIFAVPINGEKINKKTLFSILMGFAGMVIILTNGRIDSLRMSNLAGDLLAIGAAICWGIFTNLGKKNKVDAALSNYIYTLTAFILSVISMLVFSKPAIPGIPVALGLVWLGLSNIVLAYYLWFKALKVASSALIASLSFITPFVTLLFIIPLLGERVTFFQIAGLAVILAGIAVQSISEFNIKKQYMNKRDC